MVKLIGEREIRLKIADLSKATSNSMAKAIIMSAVRVEATAKDKCPKDTEALANEVSTEIIREGTGIRAKVGITAGTPAEVYGKYVEYGTGIYAVGGNGRKTPWVYYSERMGQFYWTKGMKAQPFLWPALRTNKTFITKIMAMALTEGWGKVTKK